MEEKVKPVMPIRTRLAANIKARRHILALSQEKLAELTDLSAQSISDIEGCRTWVSDKTLLKLSEALHVDIFQLLLPVDAHKDKNELNLPLRIQELHRSIREDIDKRLDRFIAGMMF